MIDDKVKRFEHSSNNPIIVLKTDECYVIVVDDTREIYLWKGLKSGARAKFIATKEHKQSGIKSERITA